MTGARVALAGGVTLHTRQDGPEGAPWLILSNSLGSTLEMWDDQIPALAANHRVLRYDTRGHGRSDAPAGPYSFADLAGDVIGLMDALGIERAGFMGLSLGGMTGLGLALDHAARISRVVCADARADAPPPVQTMWDERIAKVRAGGLEAIVEGTLAGWLTPEWHSANPQRLAAIRAMVLSNDPGGYVACCQALKGLDYLRRLDGIAVPLRYVGGALDKGAAPEVMQAMARATPGAEYRTIAGAAHVANINAPEGFAAAIADFLDIPPVAA